MGFAYVPNWAQKWVRSGLLGAKVGDHGSKPTSALAHGHTIPNRSVHISNSKALYYVKRRAAANGGVTNGGLRGVWPPSRKSAEIGLFCPFSAFFALFRRVRRAPGKSRKRRKKAFFLRYPRISLNPHLLNPHLWHPKREGFCRNPRGIFPTEFPGEFCRGFFAVDFFGPFSLEKTGGKNPRQFSNQNSGVSGPKSTLQGSGLDIM